MGILIKLQVENIECSTLTLRVSNVWGGKPIPKDRINGLVDKLINSLNTENVIELYTTLDTRIDIIHTDDLIDLIQKCIDKNLYLQHEMFVVGSQSLTIKEVLDRITSSGYLNIKLSKNQTKSYLNVENAKVSKVFNWKPKYKLV